MTRPSDVKPREDEAPGTPAEAFEVGALLPEVRFTVTPEIVDEYTIAVDGYRGTYEVAGTQVAPPNVLAVYLLAILYRKYPPIQGIILTEQSWRWAGRISASSDTEIVGAGRIEDRFEKRGKQFMRWSAVFRYGGGQPIATAQNTMYIPD